MMLLRRKPTVFDSTSEDEVRDTIETLTNILTRLEKSITELTTTTETLTFTVVASGVEGVNKDTFERLGGVYGVRQAVTLLYARIMADPELSPYFRGSDMVRIQYRQADMFLAILGIQTYTGLRLGPIHKHLKISPYIFNKLIAHVRVVLTEIGLDEAEVMGFVSALNAFENEIVSEELRSSGGMSK